MPIWKSIYAVIFTDKDGKSFKGYGVKTNDMTMSIKWAPEIEQEWSTISEPTRADFLRGLRDIFVRQNPTWRQLSKSVISPRLTLTLSPETSVVPSTSDSDDDYSDFEFEIPKNKSRKSIGRNRVMTRKRHVTNLIDEDASTPEFVKRSRGKLPVSVPDQRAPAENDDEYIRIPRYWYNIFVYGFLLPILLAITFIGGVLFQQYGLA